ncbi:interferon-induced transmembrane protein 3-like [Echinops telfairi]|uniref:Interferon-induced transmembrane protein 3-like n=1 Tax=Echinops telfairi TaxID=9371 RepID=A0AC55CRL9_ECHTE|nr:interferon-induced transmembrane protein 3-like [Echinops telfairi]
MLEILNITSSNQTRGWLDRIISFLYVSLGPSRRQEPRAPPLPRASGPPPTYQVFKEEHEVDVLGAPPTPGPAPTVISIRSEVSVPDHVVWSLFNTVYLNIFCQGFVAFAYSVKSRDWKMAGDVIGAQSYASTAKCLNLCALVFCLLIFVGIIIATVITVSRSGVAIPSSGLLRPFPVARLLVWGPQPPPHLAHSQ